MRVATPIELGEQQRAQLVALSRSQKASVRLAQRASIVLLAADGMQNLQIASQLGMSRFKVSRWRERYAAQGLPGIEKDAPRPGAQTAHRFHRLVGRAVESPSSPQPNVARLCA
jgi:transposase